MKPGVSSPPWLWRSWHEVRGGTILAIVLGITLLISGCNLSVPLGSGPIHPTATTATSTCLSHATATAGARVVAQQVHGRIGSASDATISAFSYPLGLPNEDFAASIGDFPHPGFGVFSPDGKYLATTVLLEGPNIVSSYPYLINTVTHAITRLSLPATVNVDGAYYNEWLRERSLAWANDNTLLFFTGANTNTTIIDGSRGTQVIAYDIVSGSSTTLPGITKAAGGIVRCGVLYYQEMTALTPFGPDSWIKGKAFLHRYDLSTHRELGSPLTMGDTFGFSGAESHFDGPGWDVSVDGRLLVYQKTLVTATTDRLVMTSQFIRCYPDGTHAERILVSAAPSVTMLITISPSTRLVAATDGDVEALVDPVVPIASTDAMTVAGPLSGGSTAVFFSTIGTVLPAWGPDNVFYASEVDPGATNGIGSTVYAFHLGGSAPGTTSVAATGATYPITLTP